MYVSVHQAQKNGTNSYLLAPDGGGPAILVDPVEFDINLLSQMEQRGFYLDTILLTTPERHSIHPIQTVQKIYRVNVVAGTGSLTDIACNCIQEQTSFSVGGLEVTAIPMLPHTRRSLVFYVNGVLFTGMIMHAGTLGETPNSYAEALLAASVIDHLFGYPDETPILPALGPPSNVRSERALNPWLREFLEESRL
jgi:glyoxylase-like metal-dependent hydrolase (beta-lactamase superfamily II)